MIHAGDKFIVGGILVEVKKATIDDNYIYVVWKGMFHAMRIPLHYFMDKYISVTSMLNIDYFKRKKELQVI